MPKKLYFLTTEIVPFANITSLAMFSTRVPLALQEKGHDIRTIIPKYGYVSERKYILREVIRLREIPFSFCGLEEIASAKSAFIPKTRVQVYFLESDEWFQPLNNLLYKSKNGRVLMDNSMRYAIADWEHDLNYFRKEYYEGKGLKFNPWPSSNPIA